MNQYTFIGVEWGIQCIEGYSGYIDSLLTGKSKHSRLNI